jgi:hypothetical protein
MVETRYGKQFLLPLNEVSIESSPKSDEENQGEAWGDDLDLNVLNEHL